ncbi:hypothetical protein [Deinococcus multiflagellatus]|uniref:Uncharacterized protein n=1 Tax=Deinococcus multiflagellatus TaxID=1656887 RepID=A0ABW1ZSK3_9DEIO
MSIFDERLRRLKHASRMAVTQQDLAPRAAPTPLFGAATGWASQPLAATTQAKPRRVVARVLAVPHPASAAEDGFAAALPLGDRRQLAPAAPLAPAPAGPAPLSPAPSAPTVGTLPPRVPEVPATPPTPVAAQPAPPSAPVVAPGTEAWPAPDPYGDAEEVLAAGLLTSPPPEGLPPAPRREFEPPAPAGPVPRRTPSFRETMALNQQLEDGVAADGPFTTAPAEPAPLAPWRWNARP